MTTDPKRFWILEGDAVDVMSRLQPNSIDSMPTDPPYGLEFMGKELGWDKLEGAQTDGFRRTNNPADVGRENAFGRRSRTSPQYTAGAKMQAWHEQWAAEAFRILKPGGYVAAFSGSRTGHRLAAALEDVGFQIRDTLMWLYGTGMPAGTGRLKIPEEWRDRYNTCLKPAYEPIVLARKPLSGTVAANLRQWGSGALNVEATAVQRPDGGKPRWPPNIVLTHSPGCGRTLCCPDCPVALLGPKAEFFPAFDWDPEDMMVFRYVAKPTRGERDAGCDHLVGRSGAAAVMRTEGTAGVDNPRAGAGRTAKHVLNHHPTVKPLALMRWVHRLITPPSALALDPFGGSGTTLAASILEGGRCIVIEREPEYVPIIRARAAHHLKRST